jgi:lactoylglutathione lyase
MTKGARVANGQSQPNAVVNVKQAVPFLWVHDIDASLRFYIDGLGFSMTMNWAPDGQIRWCRLELGAAAMMVQEFWKEGRHANLPSTRVGVGVSISFTCRDALAIYQECKSRGIRPERPFVGNGMWVTNVTDPDGYALSFQSPTSAPEEAEYTEA